MELKKIMADLIPEELGDASALFFHTDKSVKYLSLIRPVGLGGETVLSVSLYPRVYASAGITTPKYILCFAKEQYAVRIYHEEDGKTPTWGHACLSRLVGRSTSWSAGYYGRDEYGVLCVDVASIKVAENFMRNMGCSPTENESIWDVFDRYAEGVNERLRKAGKEKRKERISEQMALMKPVSERFERWALRKIGNKEKRLFVGIDGRKKRAYLYCEYCGGEHVLRSSVFADRRKCENFKCPVCGKRRRTRIFSGNDCMHRKDMNTGYVDSVEGGFVLRSFEAETRVWFDRANGEFRSKSSVNEKMRSFFIYKKGKWTIKRYENCWRGSEYGWNPARCGGKERVRFSVWISNEDYKKSCLSGLARWGDLEFYTGNGAALRDTKLRYINLKDIAKTAKAGMPCADAVFELLCKYPKVEWLLKMQHYELVGYASIEGAEAIGLRRDAKDIFGLLGFNAKEYRDFKALGGDLGALNTARLTKGKPVSMEDLTKACEFAAANGYCLYKDYNTGYLETSSRAFAAIKTLLAYGATFHKAVTYLVKEAARSDRSTDELCGIYSDYVKMCCQLKKDMRQSWWLMPKNIEHAHDNIVLESKAEEMRADCEAYDPVLGEIGKRDNEILADWKNGEPYTACVPESVSDYFLEGKRLCNCLYTAGYYKSVARRTTNIAFIRKSEAPDVPLYAMEWRNGRIIQIHGYKNCEADDNAKKIAMRVVKLLDSSECSA